jgi:osmoprotectant transport system substrate-binding protein
MVRALTRKKGTAPNFAAFAKLRTCHPFAPARSLLAQTNQSQMNGDKRRLTPGNLHRSYPFSSVFISGPIVFLGILLILIAVITIGCSREPRIRVGSKNFSEQFVLGEIVAQHLENRLHGHVSRKFDLGGTLLAQQAMESGEIDVYPEYTGTALTAVLKQKPLTNPKQVLDKVRAGYKQWRLEWLDPLGFENTFAMAVRKDATQARTLTEATREHPWKLGAGYEFIKREDGLPGLTKLYGLKLDGTPKTMDLGLLYQALSKKQVDLVAGNSTDGMLSVLPIKVLEDDRRYFPPYECALVVREEAEQNFPALRSALLELSGKINSETMRRLNYELDGKHRPAREIARNFLQSLKP